MSAETIYKVLGPGRTPHHGGTGKWPQRKRWLTIEGDLIPCQNGLHLCRGESQLLEWLGPEIWLAEYDGEVIAQEDKIVVRRARLLERTPWDDRMARLFAADCAESVLSHFEARFPGDDSPRKAIEATRSFARGEIDRAAWSAARSAAESVARSVARSAAWSAAESVARSAAWSVARSAQADLLGSYLRGERT
jgi:hypothetical protein